jgi:predicted amidohydrolase
VRALLAQLASVPGQTQANAERAVAALAAHPEVEIAVFPELFLGGYDLSLLPQTARPADCAELRAIADTAAAASTAVVVGFAERADDGNLANSVACIDRDGSLAAVYRKTQLFGAERDAFRPGEELVLVRLAGLDVGPLICFDIEFPEPARELARAGAELLVTASANMDPFAPDHELASRARALENHVPHLYANAVGTIGGLRLIGGSRSVDAAGAVLAEAGLDEETLLVAAIGTPGDGDERVDYLRQLPQNLRVERCPAGRQG